MKKKLFISQPMSNIPEDKILKQRKEAKEYIETIYPDYTIEVIDSFQQTGNTNYNAASAVNMLGSAISKMADADIIYFAPGWKESKGCQVENEIARRWLEDTGVELIEDGMEKVELSLTQAEWDMLKEKASKEGVSIHKYINMKLSQAVEDGTLEEILKNGINDNTK